MSHRTKCPKSFQKDGRFAEKIKRKNLPDNFSACRSQVTPNPLFHVPTIVCHLMNEIFQNNEILQGQQKLFSPLLTSPDILSPSLKSSNQRYFLWILHTSTSTSTIENAFLASQWSMLLARRDYSTSSCSPSSSHSTFLYSVTCILYLVFCISYFPQPSPPSPLAPPKPPAFPLHRL